jgi:D-alanyl-D-alanine carboxypeptidase
MLRGIVDESVISVPVLSIFPLDISMQTARSFIVFDVDTGSIITQKDATEVLPIASVTKLFTASAFYSNADTNATTTITWSDVNADGDAGRLHPNEAYNLSELLFPLLLESSNDAAVTLLRVEPTLVERMNEYVATEGAQHTHFADTSGLSPDNVSTAYELYTLSQSLYKSFPYIFDITRLKQYVGTHTGWMNNNPLVLEEGYSGGKHGFTYEANRTSVAFFDEKLSNGVTRKIGYVVLGSDNLKSDIDNLRTAVHQGVRFE